VNSKQITLTVVLAGLLSHMAVKGPAATGTLIKKTCMTITHPLRHPVKDSKAVYHVVIPPKP
jgi:hypothetical protein